MSKSNDDGASSSRQAPKYRADSSRPIPDWLLREHRRHKSSRNLQDPADHTAAKPPRAHNRPAADQGSKPMNGDYIMVDLLDGAHLPTRAPANPSPDPPSANSDSIISLPPVDAASSYFTKKREAARSARLANRTSASFGSNFYAQLPLHPPTPPASVDRFSPPHSYSNLLSSSNSPANSLNHPSAPLTSEHPPGPGHSAAAVPSSSSGPTRRQSGVSGVFPPGTTRSGPFPVTSTHSLARAASERQGSSDLVSNHPLLHQRSSPSHSFTHGRNNSVRNSADWHDDDTRSNSSVLSAARRHRQISPPFNPSEWGGRKPAEEDAVMPNAAWIYLALIGSVTFFIAFGVNSCVNILSLDIIAQLAQLAGAHWSSDIVHIAVLAKLRALSLVTSYFLVLKLSPQFSAGSGIPEMKCVLSGVLMTEMLNLRTLFAKMVGLVFSLGSGISIGRLGPFIHMSGITAAVVSESPLFPTLRTNARFQLQALSAAMAAGVGATFGAPIGGTMLAIEVMSTYYYIHWLPMALYCSIAGYYFVVTVIDRGSEAFFVTNVSIALEQASIQRVCTYAVLGAVCGVVGAGLIRFTRQAFKFRRRHFKNTTPKRTAVMLAVFAILHTVISMNLGTLMENGGKAAVLGLINGEGGVDVTGLEKKWSPFRPELRNWNVAMWLTILMMVKFVLTGISLVLPVPAGTFMPIFEVGAFLGRAFGEWCSGIPFVSWVNPSATAIIGAAGLAAGTLHTTSIAVVMLELTREAIDVLPLAVGVLVSYGVSKCLSADLFSELIRIRKLPFILGLRERYPAENRQFYEDMSGEIAGSFMNKDFPFVTPHSTRGEIYDMLTRRGAPWINCAFLSDRDSRSLWGTVSRQALWDIVIEDMKVTSRGGLDKPAYGTFNVSESVAMRGLETVEFLHNFDPSVGHHLVDMGPMQVSYHTPLWKIITFFRMLSLSTMYVLKGGETVGTLGRMELIRHTVNVEDKARKRRRNEREAEAQRARNTSMLAEALRQNDGGMRSRPSASDLSAMDRSSGRHSRQNSFGQNSFGQNSFGQNKPKRGKHGEM